MRKAQADLSAFSCYSSQTLSANKIPEDIVPNRYINYGGVRNKYLETNTWGWAIDPLGFGSAITTMYNHCKIPVSPIENGVGLKETWDDEYMIGDDERIAYREEYVKVMKDTVFLDGTKVLGYLGWGPIDTPGSHTDVEERHGAVYVNRSNRDLKDLKRVPKKSFYWSQKALKNSGDGI